MKKIKYFDIGRFEQLIIYIYIYSVNEKISRKNQSEFLLIAINDWIFAMNQL